MRTHYDIIKSSKHFISLDQRANRHITEVVSILYFIHRMLTGGAIVPKIAAKSSQKYIKNALTLKTSFSMSLKNFSTYHTSNERAPSDLHSKNRVGH